MILGLRSGSLFFVERFKGPKKKKWKNGVWVPTFPKGQI